MCFEYHVICILKIAANSEKECLLVKIKPKLLYRISDRLQNLIGDCLWKEAITGCDISFYVTHRICTDEEIACHMIQYIPRNMHTVFALLCFVVVIHWLIFPYPSGLLHWHCGNLTIAPVPAKQPWWIWINTSCEFIMNDSITTTKQLKHNKTVCIFLGIYCRKGENKGKTIIKLTHVPWTKFPPFRKRHF